jgi:hypothetical protein
VTLREKLLDAGRLARQRRHAATQVEDFGYRILTQFPQPLAYMWREWQAADASPSDKFRMVLNAAEGHTCFLALVAIAMARASGLPSSKVPKLQLPRDKGIAFGDWFNVVKNVNSTKALTDVSSATAFGEVAQLGYNGAWASLAGWFMNQRNAFAHGRTANATIENGLLAEAERYLRDLYKTSDFLTEYKLVHVTDVIANALLKRASFKYRELSGDSTLVSMREDACSGANLEKNSLYLKDRSGELHLLRPWLQFMKCPVSGQMATFVVDRCVRIDGADWIEVKSYERSSSQSADLIEECRQVGLFEMNE